MFAVERMFHIGRFNRERPAIGAARLKLPASQPTNGSRSCEPNGRQTDAHIQGSSNRRLASHSEHSCCCACGDTAAVSDAPIEAGRIFGLPFFFFSKLSTSSSVVVIE